jgi:hypothetical protein
MKGTHIAQLPDALSAAQYGTYALGLPARKCRPANALDATHFRRYERSDRSVSLAAVVGGD